MTADQLRATVPVFDGWNRGTITTQTIDVPEPAAVVSATYTRSDGSHLDLEISDTGGASSMMASLATMAESEFHREMGDGYLKGTRVAGAPAIEAWTPERRAGELTVLVNGRYSIHVNGTDLPDAAPMRALVERIDLSKLR